MGYYDMYNFDGTRKKADPYKGVLDALSAKPPTAQGPDLTNLYAAAGTPGGSGSASSLQNTSNQLLEQMLRDPSNLQGMPGYQFLMDQGTQAINRNMAASGRLNSGQRDIELAKYGQGLAAQQFIPMAQLLSGIGSSAAGQTAQTTNNLLDVAKFGYGATQAAQDRMDRYYNNALGQATIFDPTGNVGDRQYTINQFAKQWGV